MSWWMRIDRFLNPRRLTYAWVAGGALWVAWLLSVIMGPANFDLAGKVIGTDYIQFYAAGVTLRDGESTELYNFNYQSQLEQKIAGPGLTSFHAFITPPFLAWLYLPFTYLPYIWSFILWSLFGLAFLWISLKLLTKEKTAKSFLWALTWFPIFAAISFGQNSLLSLFLLSLSFLLWRREKYLLAGLVSSLLLYKPQLILGIALLWLLEWRQCWKTLAGLLLGGGLLAGLSFWLMPEASKAYIDLARNFLPGLLYHEQFPLWHLHSVRGFFMLLLPGRAGWVEGLTLFFALAGVAGYILIWRSRREDTILLFATAICLSIWLSPHAMIYDWAILLIPAILLWQGFRQLRPIWKSLFFLVWLATFISGPLTFLQMNSLPIAVQISIPIYALVLFSTFKISTNRANPFLSTDQM